MCSLRLAENMAVAPIGAVLQALVKAAAHIGVGQRRHAGGGASSNRPSNSGSERKPTSLSRKSVRTRKLWGIIIGTTTAPGGRRHDPPRRAGVRGCPGMAG